MQYKAWKAANPIDTHNSLGVPRHIFIITHAPVYRQDHSSDDPFDKLVPQPVRSLGPWQGSKEGAMEHLRPHYRRLIEEQGWVMVVSTHSGFRAEVD